MARFKLLAGQHIGPDLSQDPVEVKDKDGNVVSSKHPSRTYKVGDVIVSDVDLAAKHGSDKYQLIGGQPEPFEKDLANPAKAPGGQVSSGIQGGEAAAAKRLDEEREAKASEPEGRKLSPHEQAEYTKAKAELDKKTYPELLEIAKQRKVDIKGATTKPQVVQAILNDK